jgi:SpoVK/Ycf46/Vps4 family AAA+-type ATPase
VPRIPVVVAATRKDLDAESIAGVIARRADMELVGERYMSTSEALSAIGKLPKPGRCALILYGPIEETAATSEIALRARNDLVVLRVTSTGDVRIGATFYQMGLPELVTELRSLVDRSGLSQLERAPVIHLRTTVAAPNQERPRVGSLHSRPLMSIAMIWLHAMYRSAVASLPDAEPGHHWFGLTKATLLHELAVQAGEKQRPVPADVSDAETSLQHMLAAPHAANDPLALLFRQLNLTFLELRVVLLSLASELDPVYQRCVALLLDDVSRRVGTLSLFSGLLGSAAEVRSQLELSSNITRWRLLESGGDRLPSADEPLRLDPTLIGWLLGSHTTLLQDPRTRRVRRLERWTGLSLLDGHREREEATQLVRDLIDDKGPQWLLLEGQEPATWRALVELGAQTLQVQPIRVEPHRLAALETGELRESGLRLGRIARLTGEPLIIDTLAAAGGSLEDDALRCVLAAIGETGARAAVLTTEASRLARLITSSNYRVSTAVLEAEARIRAVSLAARGADAYLTEADALVIAAQYPLHIDGFEHAMQLARTKPLTYETDDPRRARFLAACKEVASEGLSRLAERIDPVFTIDDVVLPEDRKQQLIEIVHSVQLAPQVLDTWKFRDQLPYGRGVAVLLHGPSGAGKTMAAMGVAKALGISILRLDLSRVVSKYIGDTEKNIDQVFLDAQRSGSAILIDEADALLGKRSEVKDAHDRHANIEVAYLLQRMEAYEGLAILTTNLRQNLDPAFLRRLRFIVEFPRPDAEAREKIWRRCLPDESHELNDAEFRLLGRRIDLTGGHIRQITLRAAFVAAAAESVIRLEHIAHASRAEFAKLGMPPVELEPGPRKVA